ncbi:MAG TPA: sigma 54-interacting transcriptional regulator [Candidatus Binataceae bacterium]
MEHSNGGIPYRLIYELGNAFASRLELDPLIELATDKCRTVLNAEGVAVLWLDTDSQELYFPYFSDKEPEVAARLSRMHFSASKGIAGEVLKTGLPSRIDNVSIDPRFYSDVDKHTGLTTRAMIAAPLTADGVRVGVIEVVNPIGRENFSDDDLALLEALAASIALAVQNAQQFGRLKTSEKKLQTEVGALRRDLARHELLGEIIGASPEMNEVFRLMSSAAVSPISILLQGETGTGKELIARAIHRMSARAEKPFLAVNCAALSEHLLESELFGHRRGSFTGATKDQPGLFRAASGGVIFLDEIGEMPLGMQPTLLRVLQDGEILSVGDTRPERVDVRVFSASNRDLRTAVAAGTFRADLYYRLAAFPIRLPPLRERKRDIPLLAARFLSVACARQHKDIREFDRRALELLSRYDWPGNIRELQNEIDRAVALAPSEERIEPQHLSDELRAMGSSAISIPDSPRAPDSPPDSTAESTPAESTQAQHAPGGGEPKSESASTLRDVRNAFEARYISETLATNDGNVSRSARALGISRISLQRKIKEYGLR